MTKQQPNEKITLRGDRFHVDPQGSSGNGHTWRSAEAFETETGDAERHLAA